MEGIPQLRAYVHDSMGRNPSEVLILFFRGLLFKEGLKVVQIGFREVMHHKSTNGHRQQTNCKVSSHIARLCPLKLSGVHPLWLIYSVFPLSLVSYFQGSGLLGQRVSKDKCGI